MEEKDIVSGVHKALDTYEIRVNGSINETKTLKGWVQTLVTDNRELYNVTKELRDKQDLRNARSKVLAAFLHSRTGRALTTVWKYIKIPILTAVGSVMAYYFLRWADPAALPFIFR
jgi:hypothetical protein